MNNHNEAAAVIAAAFLSADVTVQSGCMKVPESGRKHHLHRKTSVLPCELAQASSRLRDLSVGPTMFFSRR